MHRDESHSLSCSRSCSKLSRLMVMMMAMIVVMLILVLEEGQIHQKRECEKESLGRNSEILRKHQVILKQKRRKETIITS